MFDLGLTAHQVAIADRVISQEEARRNHLVVYLSGAHAYGFPSPDSDLDLKAIHVANTRELVGLEPPVQTFDRAEIIAEVEIDYTSNELSHALAGILGGNGNFLERVLGRTVFASAPELEALRPIVKRSISKQFHRHYRGFAANQLRFLEKEPTVKKLLYVLRTALTGTHLLKTGELEADLGRLLDPYRLPEASELILAKRAGERTAADPAMLETWRPHVDRVLSALDEALATSALPDEPPNVAEVDAWLIEVRRARF